MHFKLLKSKDTGIHFNNALEESHIMNIITYPDFYSGGGVSIGDIDNDGYSDIFFTGNQVPPRLYKNKGNMVFEDITEASKLDKIPKGWHTGTSMVDLNGDGYLDIYVCRSVMTAPEDRANLLFINNQDGTFTEKGKGFGLDNKGYSVNAYFFDYDKDGDIDIYLANQTSARLSSSDAVKLRNVVDPYAGDKLFENMGNRFIDVTEESGIYSSQLGFVHGVAIGDINDDGWEDIFVSNDFFEYDYLYLNNGDKTFTESIKNATKHISHFSMGNDLADFNNDGLLDLMVLDMVAEDNRRLYMNEGGNNQRKFDQTLYYGLHYQYMFNMLHLNNGNETFSEIGMLACISRTDWSWAPLFADFDNDGLKDLYVTNGIRKDIRNIDWGYNYRSLIQFVKSFTEFEASQWDMLLNSLPYEQVTNYMFRNNGDLTFSKVMNEWGMDQKSYSNGVAYGDLDNDGDLDLVVNNVDAEAFVYENRQRNFNFIRFRFEGPQNNPLALGTKVRIFHGNHYQYQQHYLSRGYRSSMEPVMHFGLGTDTLVDKVEVVWPDSRMSNLTNFRANQLIVVKYEDSVVPEPDENGKGSYYFEDITDQLEISIQHREDEINDFMLQPMLPYKLSALGPPLAVADVNGDNLDDFYLGGAYHFPGQLYIHTIEGRFEATQEDMWLNERLNEDIGATFFDIDNDGDQDLYIVTGGNEFRPDTKYLEDRMYLNDGHGRFTKDNTLIPDLSFSGSVAEPGDFDQDGDIDLFVGGRMVPGKYPLPAGSYLYRNQNGKLEDATDERASGLKDLGMVTDALWSDYDLDGDPDLLIVGEWMPITLFKNDSGKLTQVENKNNGLEFTEGWWWHINANDFDHDGDEDYVLGNMGLNYKFQPSPDEPLELYILDPYESEKINFVIGYHQDGKIFPTTGRNKTVDQMPSLKRNIPSHDLYAISTLEDIYGTEILEKALNKKMYTLASGYLENKGNGNFEFKPFDNYAQISNTGSSLVVDIDSDGSEDLVLAGNLYTIEAETIRNDAGIGVWMKGDGSGNFMSIPYIKSGLYLDGDVRSLKKVRTWDGYYILCARNNDHITLLKINKDKSPRILYGNTP